ncbi:Ig-like domain-containing protein [Beutenbergia cavernae]|uniref:Ig-like domain-containing protein n=1 Tax=Beutenbergia cavernae TaxID=84757 RepID=UPI00019ABF30|nr:Ig-like domain-containing protein [Beutenbergia cavernae]
MGERLRRHRSRIASATVISLALGTVVALSLDYDGVATADVDLNDGGVWVNSQSDTRIGRLNRPIEEVDAQLDAASTQFDLLQQASNVLVVDSAARQVQRIDPAAVALAGGASIPARAQVALGGDVVAVLDIDTGDVRTADIASLATLEDEEIPPLVNLGADGVIAVDDAGTTYAFSPTERTLTAISPEDAAALQAAGGAEPTEGESEDASAAPGVELPTWDLSSRLEGELAEADLQLTTVGTDPVLLVSREERVEDADSGAVSTRTRVQLVQPERATVELTDVEQLAENDLSTVRLQASGPAASTVSLSTPDALVRVPLAGGTPVVAEVGSPGAPAQPVVVAGCTHGAWSGGEPTYLRLCRDEPVSLPVPEVPANAELAFRVNREVVVLNDLVSGNIWMIQDTLKLIEDWADTTPPPNPSEEEEESQQQIRDEVPLDRDAENRPPTATDDEFGLRPGRTTILPVLDNDSDPDGDLVTVTQVDSPPENVGTIEPILGNRALQITVPQDASGSAHLEYTIDDGRGEQDTATISLEVIGEESNTPPELVRAITMRAARGATVSMNVFTDIRDPDGDDLVLVGARVDNEQDTVRYTPDGTVTFEDANLSDGEKTVTLSVSDNREVAELEITVEVLPEGNAKPVAVFDFATAYVGEPVVLEPIVNDQDPNGDRLRLAQVQPFAAGETNPTLDWDGTIAFTPTEAGSFDTTYLVADDDGATSEGLIRVDVVEPVDGPPTAVRDTALLPPGGEVMLDVLVNDTDPRGEVLAVQQVDVPDGLGLHVAVLEHRLLRISADRTLTGPVTLGYSVSNGVAQAQGEVQVMPLGGNAQPQPPVAVEDSATVRVGDYVTIPVLANDSHPSGVDFSLDAEVPVPPEAGVMFATQDVLRYQAPSSPGQQVATYQITDENGQSASANVVVNVVADEGNQAPQPEPVETRAFQTELVRIPIDLVGIDPDGDSVQLLGLDSAPELGQVVTIGPDYLDYQAYNSVTGTDRFSYSVRDRQGQVATGEISVGVVEPPLLNRNPVAVRDDAWYRPGRDVVVDVLENDTDPDGDPLYLDDPAVVDAAGLEVAAENNRLVLTTPAESGTYPIQYAITDRHGGSAVGSFVLEVSPDAPLLRPVAQDDIVPVAQLFERESVDVPVLANDSDPDGTTDDLTVTLPDGQENAEVVGQEVRVTLTPQRQVVTYQITDIDDQTTYAFIDVPGVEDSGPALRTDVEPVEVRSGEPVEIALEDYVIALSGNPVQLTDASTVSATNSNGGQLVVDARTLTFTSAEDYSGPATLTFEVTDAADVDDPERLTSVLTLPIEVLPLENRPPTLRGTQIEVEAGSPEAVTVDLTRLADDPDAADLDNLTFELVSQPDGFSAELRGGTVLEIVADVDTPKGTVAPFEVSVSDGVNEPVVGAVEALAVASREPLITAADDDLGEVEQGESASVDVLANDSNPFGDGDRTIVDARIETGSGGVSFDGSNVTVTPAADFVGRMVVVYAVQDATQDPDRRVEARVRANVIGVPEVPAPPRVVSVGDRTVTLTWTAPIDNGAPITGYEVTGNGFSQTCATTTCALTGLTNNVEYTFQVAAVNKVGTGEPSAPSGVARPDVKPDTPAAPTLEFGDGQLTVSWATPNSNGSPVDAFDLQISPSTGSGQVALGVTNSYVWTGLQNGTSYQVRVRAHNQAPDPSEWSAWSAPEIPAGVPDRPQAPSASREDTPLGGRVSASWTAPPNNGDAIRGYVLTPYRNNSALAPITLPPGTTSHTISADNGADYSFTVMARNKAGDSPVSPRSNEVRSFGKPDRITSVSAAPTGSDGQVQLTFSEPSSNGQAIARYEYSANGGGWQALGSGHRANGLADGTSYTFQVRACNTYCADDSPASNAATPYGSIAAPSVSAARSGDQAVRFTWNRPDANGRPVAVYDYRTRVNGGGWSGWQGAGSGAVTVGNGYQQTWDIQVRFGVSGPTQTETGSASLRTNDPPPPARSINSVHGDRRTCEVGGGDCYYSAFDYVNLPSGSYNIRFWSTGSIPGCGSYERNYSNVPLGGSSRYQATGHFGTTCGGTMHVRITGPVTLEDSSPW